MAMPGSRKRLRLAILVAVSWALVGCAQQRIRDEANQQLREGRYEGQGWRLRYYG